MSREELVVVEGHTCPGPRECDGRGAVRERDGAGVWVAFGCGLTTLVYAGDVVDVAEVGRP